MKIINLAIYSVFLKSISCEQCDIGSSGCCETMIPPSYIPPDDSSCWQWWEPPASGIATPDMAIPPKGCDYRACEAAVCACDLYCCESAWDLSCRGYATNTGDIVENNYFVGDCSASVLCCEPEAAFTKSQPVNSVPDVTPAADISFQCVPGEANCCETMIPPSFLPPDDSTCWQWWTPPADGVPIPGMDNPPKGCNYQPCQDAVCACDPYCCNSAWDLSCRGYEMVTGAELENNYFVDQCSAKILCCEQESAFPDPSTGAILPPEEATSEVLRSSKSSKSGSTKASKGSKSAKGTKAPKGSKSSKGSFSASISLSPSAAPTEATTATATVTSTLTGTATSTLTGSVSSTATGSVSSTATGTSAVFSGSEESIELINFLLAPVSIEKDSSSISSSTSNRGNN